MGQWTIVIHGTGAHHNWATTPDPNKPAAPGHEFITGRKNDYDADLMFAEFVDQAPRLLEVGRDQLRLHQVLELRVQVADGRARQGLEHPRADVGRAGAHEDAPWRLETLHV